MELTPAVREPSAKYLLQVKQVSSSNNTAPPDWVSSILASCAETSSGTTPARALASRYFNGGTIPWVKTLDLNNSTIQTTDECVTTLALQETSLRLYPAGTVLVAMYGGYAQIGRTGLLSVSATVNQALTAIQPIKQALDSRYLLFVLNYKVDYWKSVASSSRKDPNITGADVRSFPIALPSLEEQRAIATALSDVVALIAGLERLIAKKRDIKQATMQQLLTGQTRLPGFSGEWRDCSLGQIAHIKTGSRNNEDKVEDGAYPFFVRSANVERINTYSHDCEAILVPGEGQIGSIFHYVNGRFDVHQRVYAITQFTDGISGRFVHLFMSQHFGVWAMQNTVKATVDSLRLPTFQTFEMRVPPTIEEQTAIATVLSDMDADIEALESRLAKTRAIKQGMMQELLTGRTRLI